MFYHLIDAGRPIWEDLPERSQAWVDREAFWRLLVGRIDSKVSWASSESQPNKDGNKLFTTYDQIAKNPMSHTRGFLDPFGVFLSALYQMFSAYIFFVATMNYFGWTHILLAQLSPYAFLGIFLLALSFGVARYQQIKHLEKNGSQELLDRQLKRQLDLIFSDQFLQLMQINNPDQSKDFLKNFDHHVRHASLKTGLDMFTSTVSATLFIVGAVSATFPSLYLEINWYRSLLLVLISAFIAYQSVQSSKGVNERILREKQIEYELCIRESEAFRKILSDKAGEQANNKIMLAQRIIQKPLGIRLRSGFFYLVSRPWVVVPVGIFSNIAMLLTFFQWMNALSKGFSLDQLTQVSFSTTQIWVSLVVTLILGITDFLMRKDADVLEKKLEQQQRLCEELRVAVGLTLVAEDGTDEEIKNWSWPCLVPGEEGVADRLRMAIPVLPSSAPLSPKV